MTKESEKKENKMSVLVAKSAHNSQNAHFWPHKACLKKINFTKTKQPNAN